MAKKIKAEWIADWRGWKLWWYGYFVGPLDDCTIDGSSYNLNRLAKFLDKKLKEEDKNG